MSPYPRPRAKHADRRPQHPSYAVIISGGRDISRNQRKCDAIAARNVGWELYSNPCSLQTSCTIGAMSG